MANMPNNPNYQNHKATGTDTSLNESVVGGGTGTLNSVGITATATGNKVATRADGALYDTIAGAYIAIQNTNLGTTAAPKNGQ